MDKDHSNRNLQKASFKNGDLSFANFSGSDLRGVDFSGADLTGADFTRATAGITTTNVALIFIASLLISLLSGYTAMLAGHTLQEMLHSNETNMKVSGWMATVIILLFIIYAYWKGVGNAIRKLIIPAIAIAILLGMVMMVTGLGTGKGVLYIILAFLLVVVMFIIGTICRAAVGSLSTGIMFLVVAFGGGIFGRSIGGGIGTVVMAVACMQISKRALSGKKGFESLQKIASLITSKLGTSFRNTNLINTNFSEAKIHNVDFTHADDSSIIWNGSNRVNCINSDGKFTAK